MRVAPSDQSLTTPVFAANSSSQAGRMIGAMFFSVFGGAWLALWGFPEFRHPLLVLSCVGVGSLALFGWAYGSYRSAVCAFSGGVNLPENKKTDRVF